MRHKAALNAISGVEGTVLSNAEIFNLTFRKDHTRRRIHVAMEGADSMWHPTSELQDNRYNHLPTLQE